MKMYNVYQYNRATKKTGQQLGKNLPINEADQLAMEQARQIKEVEALDGKIKRLTAGENCVFDICGQDEAIIVICKQVAPKYPIQEGKTSTKEEIL
jgi:electron transfer flavoprotein alpha/beta subunit